MSRGYGAMLSEDQIRAYVQRCPVENRWAFEGWLRGERQLDGDPIEREPDGLWKAQLWLGDQLIEEHIGTAASAHQYANVTRRRVEGLLGRRVTCEQVFAQATRQTP